MSSKKSRKTVHQFNRPNPRWGQVFGISSQKKSTPKKKHTSANKVRTIKDWQPMAGSGHGLPTENFKTNPKNGFMFIDEDTGDPYLFLKKFGWINLSSWQPAVGEGPPSTDNPPEPLTGDQYLDAFTGDFYIYTEGIGWVLGSGIEGPPGPPGPTYSFELTTSVGQTGPTISGPLKVDNGQRVNLWLDEAQQLHADLV